MNQFIDLKRQFRDLTNSELEDPELLVSLNDHGLGDSVDWSDLLRYKRVVLLAEAGSGKTREMEEKAKRISEEGGFAFFVPLESLDRDDLTDALSPEEQNRFEAWKLDGEAPAHFFLDAVDELKLTDGKLDRALLKFSQSIGQNLDRVQAIISCRPNDWRANLDLRTVEKRLPIPTVTQKPLIPDEEAFLRINRHSGFISALRCDSELLPIGWTDFVTA
jgi:hypothetical protein